MLSWKRFASTMVDAQHPFPELMPWFKAPISLLNFQRDELKHLDWLFTIAPCFPVRSENIKVISEPKEFYETIMNKCEEAKERITFASLYVGTGKLEQNLISVVDSSLSKKSIIVNVLLDYQRGTRGSVNSKSLLLPLLQKFDNRCKISLYHTPYLRGLYKRIMPQRWNELIGLQHMKVYLIDDSVIMSGANLSNDYFTNRQDRYIMIEDKDLANFYSCLIKSVQDFSLEVCKDDTIKNVTNSLSPYYGNQNEFILKAHEKVQEFFKSQLDTQMNKGNDYLANADTWVFPLIEMGQLGIHHDSLVTSQVISGAPAGTNIRMATGYFNLTKDYMNTIIHGSQATCSLLMAHPNANGFQGAKGPAGGIPAAYSLLAKKFYDQLVACAQDHRVSLLEYERNGWSFHAKGLWYYLPGSTLPTMTLIGSPNFGERSVHRDLESQMAIVTVNETMRRKLHEECERLHSHADECKNCLLNRKTPRWIQMTVGMFRNYF